MTDLRAMDATLDGYAWLPRMIDKARAAQDGTLGDRVHPCPVDRRCLALLGIDLGTFHAAVAGAGDDRGVLRALRAAGVASAEEAWFDAPAWEDALQAMVWPSEGETISDRPSRNVVILAAREALTVTWSRYAAGERGPDLHLHRAHTDAFYVLSGALTFTLGPDGGRTVRATAGTFVAAPPDVAHSFGNDEAQDDVTWLNLHAPDAGFAAFLRGARDGRSVPFDAFDVPAEVDDPGRPAADAVVVAPGPDGGLTVEGAGLRVVADRFRVDVHALADPAAAPVSFCRI